MLTAGLIIMLGYLFLFPVSLAADRFAASLLRFSVQFKPRYLILPPFVTPDDASVYLLPCLFFRLSGSEQHHPCSEATQESYVSSSMQVLCTLWPWKSLRADSTSQIFKNVWFPLPPKSAHLQSALCSRSRFANLLQIAAFLCTILQTALSCHNAIRLRSSSPVSLGVNYGSAAQYRTRGQSIEHASRTRKDKSLFDAFSG
ncbi:hypothetical protein B0J12DRAFT_440052 [Macrophomina phaseolina]|uniref:Secreted protein n=1 Tax=Macrophomina phaseolina TaxID=35725 RepID=A0ABQ8GHS2_9PEZI|nr:hypothetical protein B0J12DRAFT_440052 [Macrophomina phaseolina]